MKKFYSYILIAATLLIAASCNKENPVKEDNTENGLVTFHATYEPESKTVIGGIADGKAQVLWNGKENIVVSGTESGTEYDKGYVFERTDGESESPSAEFAAFADLTGDIYAIYPGNNINFDIYNGDSRPIGIYEDLSGTQTAKAGSFADKTMISVAKADENNNLLFKHVTGVISFTLGDDFNDVVSVSFSGNNGEDLAGRIKIGLPDLDILEKGNQQKSVILNAEEGSVLQTGVAYYMVALPAVLDKGFTIEIRCSDGKIYRKSGSSKNEIKKGVILNIPDPLAKSDFSYSFTEKLYICGNPVKENVSDNSEAYWREMTRSEDDPNLFTWEGRLNVTSGNGAGIYFMIDPDDWDHMIRPIEANTTVTKDSPVTNQAFSYGEGENYNWFVNESAIYSVTLDFGNRTVSIAFKEALAPEVEPIETEALYICGNPVKEDVDSSSESYWKEMTRSAEDTNVFIWKGKLNVTSGDGAGFYFMVDYNDWDHMIRPVEANTTVYKDTPITGQAFSYPTGGNYNWFVEEAGVYEVSVDLAKRTVSIALSATGSVSE